MQALPTPLIDTHSEVTSGTVRNMSGTYTVVMGDRGRLVVPAELRERLHLEAGSTLILLDTPGGLILATREQLLKLVREDLRGLDLVGELIAERRRQAALDDVP